MKNEKRSFFLPCKILLVFLFPKILKKMARNQITLKATVAIISFILEINSKVIRRIVIALLIMIIFGSHADIRSYLLMINH